MMKNEIKALGKLITSDLNLQNDFDIMNKWMITYIAEKMHKYDIAETEVEKTISGEKCSDAIMKFWKHRQFNSRWNPLEGYSELLETLNRMVSNEYGVDIINFISSGSVEEGDLKEKSKNIRKVASWLIEDHLFKEFGEVRDLNDDQWIDIIDDLNDLNDLGDSDSGVIRLLSKISDGRESAGNDYIEYRVERIEYVIELLNKFAHAEREKLRS